ncbi:hypothetical protein M409DRAFT_53168 [Zasmidium cellare ATCC 36951]|uniref:F-box domain-containing protein n=1 Tax=Zasmidium cellare ATCC 36951 TaxID=1080233 RepID=A0A6A6CPA7_ZASCE|nr:uncharacterized protein M409DRAFT_53168 [Zasmidium cellare ATCC 36951]KAF2168503.1 hypothetical protein M409DRAFT_53168 [Zasmidium cellare ATCC 36951]
MARNRKTATSVNSSTVSSALSSRYPSRASSPEPPRRPFRFFDLPSELRLRIYEELLWANRPVDLDPDNFRMILPRLALFLVSRRMHEEAYRVFFAQTIRLFPQTNRFYHTKKPLLQRLPIHYRNVINTMDLVFGPGWTKPPRCQNIKPDLGLLDCTNLRTLKIFVTIDPSEPVFNGFRGEGATEDTYKWFCVDLLRGILEQVPSLETIEIDANTSVKKHGPLLSALRRTVEAGKKRLIWGPRKQLDTDEEEPEIVALDGAMASMAISNEAPLAVTVQA